MSLEVDEIFAKAVKLAEKQDVDQAMLLADKLVRDYPNEMKAWWLRSYLHELADEYMGATADVTRAIELNGAEPHLYYSRGRYQFQLENDESAVGDFSKALMLSDLYKSDYYREELHFWRAEALLRLGKPDDALIDLSKVGDDFTSWTYQLRTKEQVLRDCKILGNE